MLVGSACSPFIVFLGRQKTKFTLSLSGMLRYFWGVLSGWNLVWY